MGRIVEMIRSSDGEERATRVMMPNRSILQQSIMHLCPTECNDEVLNKENYDNLLNDNNLKVKLFKRQDSSTKFSRRLNHCLWWECQERARKF